MQNSQKTSGTGYVFLSGFLAGGLIGAAVVFLLAVPLGREWADREGIVLKEKSVDLYEAAKHKSISLTHALHHQETETDGMERMIPIPKDYITR